MPAGGRGGEGAWRQLIQILRQRQRCIRRKVKTKTGRSLLGDLRYGLQVVVLLPFFQELYSVEISQ